MSNKTRIGLGMLALVIGIIVYNALQERYGTTTVENMPSEAQNSIVSTSTPQDVVEAARLELERINQKLDAEETQVHENIDLLEGQIEELEKRLEEIRETRISFQ